MSLKRRQATGSAGTVNSPAENPSPSEKYRLTHGQLLDQLEPTIQNAQSLELAILQLMLNYSFGIPHLESLLVGNVTNAMAMYPALP